MESQLVFQEKTELERLRVQNELLSCYEVPVFERFFSDGQALDVLDIGCNDGAKTVERFSSGAVSRVIGLEYNGNWQQKRKSFTAMKDSRFSFVTWKIVIFRRDFVPSWTQSISAVLM